MTHQLRSNWRRAVAGVAVAVTGAVAGLIASPRPAAAFDDIGWSCFGSDSCHTGTMKCCRELIDVNPGSGRCSTSCPIYAE